MCVSVTSCAPTWPLWVTSSSSPRVGFTCFPAPLSQTTSPSSRPCCNDASSSCLGVASAHRAIFALPTVSRTARLRAPWQGSVKWLGSMHCRRACQWRHYEVSRRVEDDGTAVYVRPLWHHRRHAVRAHRGSTAISPGQGL